MMETKTKWVCLLKWKNMDSTLFEPFRELSTQYLITHGKSLDLRGMGEWSEMGYWE